MSKTSVVRARIDSGVKDQATRVLDAFGLTISDVLREVLVQVVHHQQLPFPVRTSLGAMREATITSINEEQFWRRKRVLQAADHAKAAAGTLQLEETVMIPARMVRGAMPQWPKDAFAECGVPFE